VSTASRPYAGFVLECVPNVSEGRDSGVLDGLVRACGASLLDVHCDPDHHRSVFTLAGPSDRDVLDAIRQLACAVAATVDLRTHYGVHPRFGALDVVPFVALDDQPADTAITAAHAFAEWISENLEVPVYLYGDADSHTRSLPDARAVAFGARAPDFGPKVPHPRLGAVAVGARAPMIAVNCVLTSGDDALARAIAHRVRERDGGLPGVRALGFELASRQRAQVSMNLVDLARTGLQRACEAVHDWARAAGCDIETVEVVGLIPATELARCDAAFRAWAGLSSDLTIEGRVAARRLDVNRG
jgi:glutamate formiminotransferase